MKIKKGDKVRVIAGKDRGREGEVEKVLPKKKAIVVAGLNIYKKAVRPRQKGDEGGIVEIAQPMDVSNVMLLCPNCSAPTRIGYDVSGEDKMRICKKCDQPID